MADEEYKKLVNDTVYQKLVKDPDYREIVWDEYKYRHTHIWSTVYKTTAGVVALGIVPYLDLEKESRLVPIPALLILIPPILGLILAVFSLVRVTAELKLLA